MKEINLSFNKKNIFVGGSTNGIGWSSAKQFAKYGGNITLVSRNIELLKQRLQKLQNNGHQQHFILLHDFSNPENLEKTIKDFVQSMSINYDIIINNTGGPPSGATRKCNHRRIAKCF